MSMRELLAGGGLARDFGLDGFVARIYQMSADQLQAYLVSERNKALFYAAMSDAYTAADLITHPDFLGKLCVNATAIELIAANSTSMAALRNSTKALTDFTKSRSAMERAVTNAPVIAAIISNNASKAAVFNSGIALNEVLKSDIARSTVATVNHAGYLDSARIRILELLSDTTLFKKVLNNHFQYGGRFAGSPPVWGGNVPSSVIVVVKTAGYINGWATSGFARWKHAQNENYILGEAREGLYTTNVPTSWRVSIGGIFVESGGGTGGVVVDAWEAL